MPPRKLGPKECYVERRGHCTRCAQTLAPDETGFMVWDRVAWGVFRDKDVCLGAHARWVAVCRDCMSPDEAAETRTKMTCPGCGLTLSIPEEYEIKACSSACAQRAVRKLRRPKQHFCEVCKVEFTSARRDARFCSDACRQWAYRRRRNT